MFPLTEEATLDQYLRKLQKGCTRAISNGSKGTLEKLNGIPLYVQPLAPAEFIHFGTSQEFRDLLVGKIEELSIIGWDRYVLGYSKFPARTLPINSCIDADCFGHRFLLKTAI